MSKPKRNRKPETSGKDPTRDVKEKKHGGKPDVESARTPGASTSALRNPRVLLVWAVLFIGVFAAYSPTFTNDFVYDDKDLILSNPLVTGHQYGEIWQRDLWAETPRPSSLYYRPLVAMSFARAHAVFGENAAGFHLVNVVLHCLVIFLLFVVARDIYGREKQAVLMAFLTAFLYAFHPGNSQIVYWIAARGDLMVVIGILLGLVCVRRSGPLALVGTVLSVAIAMFAKETGVLYLVLVPMTCFFFCEKQNRRRTIASRLLIIAPVVVIYVLLRQNAVPFGLGTPTEENFWTSSDGLVARYLTVPAIWGYYLLRAVFPYFLNFETNIHLFYSVTDWQFLAGLASIVATIVLVMRFRKNRVFLWAFLFWLVSLLPFLNIFVPTFESGMEHYLYLPLVAFVILVVSALPKRRAVIPVVGVLILSFAITIFVRGKAWSDDVSLWSDAVAKTDVHCRQGWTRSRSNLGHTYIKLAENDIDRERNLENAETLYREIVGEYKGYGYAWRGLGDIAVNRQEHEKAEGFYRRAVEARPHDYMLRNKLGVVLLAQKKLEDAKEQYEKSLEMNPGYPAAVLNLIVINMRLGDYEETDRLMAGMDATAFARYPNARAIKTAIEVASGGRASGGAEEMKSAIPVLDQMGLYNDEVRILEALLASNSIDANEFYRLAMVHIVRLDDRETGIRYLDEGLERYPDDANFLRARSLAYEQAGDKAAAAGLLERLLRVAPHYRDRAAVEAKLRALQRGK